MTPTQLPQQLISDIEFAIALAGKTYPDRAEAMSVRLAEYRALSAQAAPAEPVAQQAEQAPEYSSDGPCKDTDGCLTELAVLKRFWREHQKTAAALAQPVQPPSVPEEFKLPLPQPLRSIGSKWIEYAQDQCDPNDIAFAIWSAIHEAAQQAAAMTKEPQA